MSEGQASQGDLRDFDVSVIGVVDVETTVFREGRRVEAHDAG